MLQLLRDLFDGPDIGSDILAHHAVASGGSTHQLPVLVFEAARKAVDLDLDHILRFNACIPHSAVKITQFIVGKCIQQALHLDRMGHFLEATAGRSADVLGGRRGRDQLGVLRFQLLQLPGQGVVFEVLQLGGILIVIKAVILLDNSAQFLDALSGLFQFHSSTLLPDTASRPRLISHAIVYHKTGHFVNEKTELPSPFAGKCSPVVFLLFRWRWYCRRPRGPGRCSWSSRAPRPRGSPPAARPSCRRCGCTCPARAGRQRGSPLQKHSRGRGA